MSISDIPQWMYIVSGIIGCGAVVAVFVFLRRTCPANQALVINGTNPTPRIRFRSAWVIPPFMVARPVDLSPKTMTLTMSGRQGLHCTDYQKIDLTVTYALQVIAEEAAVLEFISRFGAAASFAGDDSCGPGRSAASKSYHDFFQSNYRTAFTDIVRGYALKDVTAHPEILVQEFMAVYGGDSNGVRLSDMKVTSCTPTALDQYDPKNMLDAKGLPLRTKTVTDQQQRDNDETVEAAMAAAQKATKPEEYVAAIRQLGFES